MKRLFLSALIIAELALPTALRADPVTASAPGAQTLNAVISSFEGKYGLIVREIGGSLDRVTLHKGTIINPTGFSLKTGVLVTIVGHADGATFDADRIDAPIPMANQPRSAGGTTEPYRPAQVPTGTFQTNGPSAVGGG
jgi:hypothetical protein